MGIHTATYLSDVSRLVNLSREEIASPLRYLRYLSDVSRLLNLST